MWADTEIDLKSVFGAEPITSVTDKLFKIRTHTIVLHIKSFTRDKYILHYIDEDPERICNKIMKLAVKTRK